MVGVAQLVRVPGCGPGGHGFDPHRLPQNLAIKGQQSLFFYARMIILSLSFSGRPY